MAQNVENFLPLLQKIATDNEFKTCDIKVKPISTGGANYSSLLYLAHISGDGRDDLRLFVKVATTAEEFLESIDANPYDLERFVYNELFTAFRELEDRNRVADQNRLCFPKYYGSEFEHSRDVLVLEDLSSQGFMLQDRLKPVDWEYASAAITQLARFHAMSIACAHKIPIQNKKFQDKFQNKFFKEGGAFISFFESGLKTALEAVKEENKEKLIRFYEKNDYPNFCRFFDTKRHPVLLHGDFRPSNMMHRPRENGTVEVIPVDYQTLQYGSPAIDFMYFVFTAFDTNTRKQYYDRLVDHYHTELGNTLRRFGLLVENNIYSKEDLQAEFNERLPYGLQVSLFILPIILISEEDAPKVEDGLNVESLSNLPTGELYKQRLNDLIDEFIDMGIMT